MPSAVGIAVATGANLMKSSQPMKRVWSFSYFILTRFFYAIYLIYFITTSICFIFLQLLVSVVIYFN